MGDMERAYHTLFGDQANVGYMDDPSLIRPLGQAVPQMLSRKNGDGGVKRKMAGEHGDENADANVKKKSSRSNRRAVWCKYGQKIMKGKDYIGMKMQRCYYRCNFPGCQVKKHVESNLWASTDPTITIVGTHNHPVEKSPEDDGNAPCESRKLELKPRHLLTRG